MNTVRKWLEVLLSGASVSLSILNNLIIAWVLSSFEFNKWIACTSLLPIISIAVSPFASSALRHDPTDSRRKRVAITSLIVLNVVFISLAAIGATVGVAVLRIDFFGHIILWLAMTSKVSLDSVLLVPEIFGDAVSEKIWRLACPMIIFISLVGLKPNTFFDITIVNSVATVVCSLAFILIKGRWFWTDVRFLEIFYLYCERWKYVVIATVSLGVFSVPVYLYSLRGVENSIAFLGVTMNLLNGAVAFITLVHSRAIPRLLEDLLTARTTIYRVSLGIIGWSALSALGTLMVMLIFLNLKKLQYSFVSILLGSLLVFVETYQVVITSILLRAGSTSMLKSAFLSASVNISISLFVSDINVIIISLMVSQILAYVVPGNRVLSSLCKRSGCSV